MATAANPYEALALQAVRPIAAAAVHWGLLLTQQERPQYRRLSRASSHTASVKEAGEEALNNCVSSASFRGPFSTPGFTDVSKALAMSSLEGPGKLCTSGYKASATQPSLSSIRPSGKPPTMQPTNREMIFSPWAFKMSPNRALRRCCTSGEAMAPRSMGSDANFITV